MAAAGAAPEGGRGDPPRARPPGRRRPRWYRRALSPLARLNPGERIAAVSALALLVFTFFDWYGAEAAGKAHFATDAGGSAWQTLSVVLVVLLVTVALALGMVALRLAGSSWRPVVPLSAALAVLGGLSALLVLWRLLDPPGLGSVGGIELEATLRLGAFLALAAALGVAYGGYRAMGEAGDSFSSIADALRADPGRTST